MTAVPLEHLDVPGLRARSRQLAQLRQQLAAINPQTLHTSASKSLDGWPARVPGSGEPGGGTSGTPPAPARLGDHGPIVGDTRQQLQRFDQALQRALHAVTDMLHYQAAICHVADYKGLADNTPHPDACQVMHAVGHFLPAKGAHPTDVAGTLEQPLRISSAVYDFVRKNGRLPTMKEREAYAESDRSGKKLSWGVQHVNPKKKGRRRA